MNQNISIKKEVVDKLLELLKEKLISIRKEIDQTRQAAIEAPGRMQSRHDSSKQELSYLVDGLLNLLTDFQRDIVILERFKIEKSKSEGITIGSIIQVKTEGGENFYCILPGGGGTIIDINRIGKITIVTPQTPLARSLLGKKVGDCITVGQRKLTVLSIF